MGKMKQLLDDEVFDEPRESNTWPFPQHPLPIPQNNNPPKFNPNNHEDAPL